MAQPTNSIPTFMKRESSAVFKPTINRIQLSIPSLKDKYVAVIPNAFSKAECEEWIHFSEEIGYKDALVNLGFGHQHAIHEFRNHKKFSIDNPIMSQFVFERLQPLIPATFNNRKVIDINERLRFLRYAPNQYFGAHYDGMFMRNNGQRSLITIVIYLNDHFDGGEITFLHPTDQNKTHSIKPHTGMVLLFEQSELFHEGSIVLHPKTKENVFKYLVRSDIMYSNAQIVQSTSNKIQSYEVEKQKAYFQRQHPIKSMSQRPNFKHMKTNDPTKRSITTMILHSWLMDAFQTTATPHLFPIDLYEEIAKYCRIIGVLDFLVDSEELETLARAAETAERYKEMMELMSALVEFKSRSFKCNKHTNHNEDEQCELLNTEQRNLLSVAYKNVVGGKRASWRTLTSEVDKGEEKASPKLPLYVMEGYKRIVEMEIKDACLKMVDLLENYILNTLETCVMEPSEGMVFYKKMLGDYYRYLSEIFYHEGYKEKAELHYSGALILAKGTLKNTHPTMLGLALNYAVFSYEIAKEPARACHLAKTAFDNAIENLDALDDFSYKDSTLIMRLLRDNLTLWTSEPDDNDDT
eukprot:25904_1